MRQNPVTEALQESPIGQALLAYWDDLPLWMFGNIALAVSLLPAFTAWLIGSNLLAILLSFPAAFMTAGIANVAALSARDQHPRWRDLWRGRYPVALSVWALLAVILLTFGFDTPMFVFIIQCVIALISLMLSPFALCISVLHPTPLRLVWRNALVLAVHFPMIALGLLALAFLMGWIVVLSKGALWLVMPALWICVAMHTTDDITRAR
ncbi:MAG: hypothetical protein IT324_20845 [Anaerolineae bacterium]|nr:hypothetical protein [Anaerolineae bacterium]